MTKIAVLQMNTGINPARNRTTILNAIERTAQSGAVMMFTPEMCSLLDRDRDRSAENIVVENQNSTLTECREACVKHSVWCALGSIPVDLENGKFANRAIVIDAKGTIVARYDKMHMFDAELENGESYHESSAYDAGEAVVVVETPIGKLGLTICYDIRFPALFAELGRQKCDAIATPAAFTQTTGRDHWHLLQRARAVEASAYCIAAAQTGHHEDGRDTYGHSLVVDPWGKAILDMGEGAGLDFAEINPSRIEDVRRQLPSLRNRRDIPRALVR